MSDIDEFLSLEYHHHHHHQQQQQQWNIYSLTTENDFSFTIGNLTDNNLINLTNRNENDQTYDIIHQFQLTSFVYAIIFGLICACLCFLTITGNLLVLITFRRIRTVGNLFILSLATADLIVGCFVMPLAGIYAIMEKWQMGLVLCRIWLSVDYTASTASIFNLLTLSLDRYWSITSPLQYLGKRTRTRALLLIGFAWGLSLLWVIPIFGWDQFSNDNNTQMIDDDKCEPGYLHSKVFKVTTAIINFYLPLFVLMSLNGRIYYEIKRRYKNVLLQRHSTKLNDNTITTCNSNSLYNYKLNLSKANSPTPITVTLCDSDKQMCSTTINYIENDSLILSKPATKFPMNDNQSILRINFKEKKSTHPKNEIVMSEQNKPVLQRTYSCAERNRCTQDELTWLAQRREHSHHHLCVDPSPRIYTNKQILQHQVTTLYHQTSVLCRHASLMDAINNKSSSSSPPLPPSTTTTTTTMNVFNLCHCCSAATSEITIHSNPFVNTNITSNTDAYIPKRNISITSLSSLGASTINRKSQTPLTTTVNRLTSSTSSSFLTRSNSSHQQNQTKNKIRQTTVWNQQEKAFRQLFAIVFGFTCCFLPYFILYMVVAFCGSCVSERIVTATVWLGYVNSTINPFLYALSNKHFRRTFNRLLKRNNRQPSAYN